MAKMRMKKVVAIETAYGRFSCVFEPEKDMGGYMAEARGVQGAVSWGKTLAEAKRMIKEAIEGAIETNVVARAEKQGVFRMKTAGRSLAPTA